MWPFTDDPTPASWVLLFLVVMAAAFVVRGVVDNVRLLRDAVSAGEPAGRWVLTLALQVALPVVGTVLYLGQRPPES